ncbi:SusC/RagA family TonB-linked outer membrane protein [Pedobacter mendelii]|uniref:SusC/RagA family TonB-linked outer membrane protein n=1 Tax=Pedobacter mendelii TaxID=1908240 RepID=A0ABQ2BMW3_9SPHI|nr:TonB-dependent receptor [Pedobacter mendelii]GGI28940.1 SusC/RagA family TonB-linked outer membrane protein [Pedobacter mendelii]
MKKLLQSLFVLVFIAFTAVAQERTITGVVTSQVDGLPIPGVSVRIKGSPGGIVTSSNGKYSLTVNSKSTGLEFSYVGFISQTVSLTNTNVINVSLQSSSRDLDELVVVGYGTQKKGSLTGAQGSVSSSDIQNTPILNPQQGLQGRVAGVQVTQASGTPGGGISINIRGASSISGSNQPLYVIDGIPVNTGSYTQVGAGGQLTNSLGDISPSDIESMEILKDAAATAIYGSRGANGVVLINTKRGLNQNTKIGVNVYSGIQEVAKTLPTLTGPEYIQLMNDAVNARYGGTANYSDSRIGGGVRSANPNDYPTTNWQDLIFETAPITNYEINARGGNDKTKFAISSSFFDQKGVVIGSGYKRFSGRLNLDNQATDKLKLTLSTSFSSSVNNRLNNDNNINGTVSGAFLLGSHVPAYNANGTYGRDAISSVDNPLAGANENTFKFYSNRLLASGGAEYKFTPELTFKSQASVDYFTSKDRTFLSTLTNAGSGSGGSATEGQNQEVNYIFDNTLNYAKVFGGIHSVNLLAGFSYQESNYENILASATGFPGNDIRRLSAGSVRTTATSGGTSNALESYFARANYSYKGKYIFQASGRLDGSSRFGSEKRYGFFPAVSGAWRMSEESFLKNVKAISDLKIRASYGIVGNQEIGNFTSLPLVGGGSNYLQNPGLAPTQLGNVNLTWENTAALDLGLDLGLFNNRLTLNVDVYQKKTSDLLLGKPLVGSSGFTTIQSNLGKTENKGLEVALTGVIFNKKDFSWTTNFNISLNKNKIVELSGNPFAAGFASWVEAGQSLGAFRGYRVLGIFQSAAEIAASPVQAVTASPLTSTAPGDIKFADLNGDGVINSLDQEIIGKGVPTYQGGFTNNFKYKNFDLSVFLQYQGGNQIYSNTRSFGEGMNSVFGQLATTLDRWTPTNTNTTVPRAVYQDPNNNRRVSDRFLEDGDFLRIKNVSLSYNFGPKVLNALKVSAIKLYASAQNLYTFTNYSGLDPEVSTFSVTNTAPGTDFLTYPQARTYTFGLNLTF